MNLTFSAEQRELIEAVRRFSAEQITPARLMAWEREPRGIDERCWRSIADLGWLGLGLPPAAGGSGLGLVDVACVLSECARGLVPTIVAHAIRGSWALSQLDPDATELASLADGARVLLLAMDEEHARDPGALATRVAGRAQETHLTGEKWYVPHAAAADLFLVAARDGEGIVFVLADGAAAKVDSMRSFVAGESQGTVRFAGAGLRRLSAARHGTELWERSRLHQAAFALAEMIGGMDKVLESTVAYVKEREQFGQKIGVFQAVQHQVADMATAYTAARHLAWQAITRIAAGHLQGIDLPAAAAFVGQSYKRLTMTAHHLHGGAGFVVEHPLHYFSERAQSLCIRYTPEAKALEEIAAALLD